MESIDDIEMEEIKQENSAEVEENLDLFLNSQQCDPLDANDEAEVNLIIKQEIEESIELKCRCCKFVAYSLEKLEKHENGHRLRGTFLECDYCDFCTNTREVMIQHVTKHTGERPFKCKKCEFSSRWKRDLIKHQVKHSDEKKFMCSQCDFTTKWYNNIRHHQITHTTERPFTCHICDMKFKRKTGLDYHLYRHNDYKPKKCSKCEFRCKTNFELKYHQHKHSDIRNYPCTFPGCAQKCKTKSDLVKHSKIHTNIRDKICEICNKGFVTLANLSKHKLRHVTERNFKCDLCGNRFKTRTSLRHHFQTHSDNKPFSCDVCGHEFRNRHNLKTHKLTHSGDRQYKCPICPYAGKFPFHIFAHIGTFHGDQFAYFCEICRKPFSRYSQLQTHCGRMHKDKDMLKSTYIKTENDEIAEGSENMVTKTKNNMACKDDINLFSKQMETSTIETNCYTDMNQTTTECKHETDTNNEDPTIKTEEPNVIIYNIGPFRLPLASKGFNFNFDKTGKKPKHWFMEPHNMSDKKAAEKQRAYIEKKARSLDKSRGATIRKFGWKKPPFKPRQTTNPRYQKDQEKRVKSKEIGRIFVKQDPDLSDLINVGRNSIRKIKICKRAGQMMKQWKELEVKLEKIDGEETNPYSVTVPSTTDTAKPEEAKIDINPINKDPHLPLEHSNSPLLKSANQSQPIQNKPKIKKRKSKMKSNNGVKKTKIAEKLNDVGLENEINIIPETDTKGTVDKKAEKISLTETLTRSFQKPVDAEFTLPQSKKVTTISKKAVIKKQKVKRPVGRPRKKSPQIKKIADPQSKRIKSVNDLLVFPLLDIEPTSTTIVPNSERGKADSLIHAIEKKQMDNPPYASEPMDQIQLECSKTVPTEVSASEIKSKSTSSQATASHASTGRLTLAINKLLEKKTKESSVSDTHAITSVNEKCSQLDVSSPESKHQRKSESPRKIAKRLKKVESYRSMDTEITDPDDIPLSHLKKCNEQLLSEQKRREFKFQDAKNDKTNQNIKQSVGRPKKTANKIDNPDVNIKPFKGYVPLNIPNPTLKRTAMKIKDTEKANLTNEKILENLLRQPFRPKRNLTDLDVLRHTDEDHGLDNTGDIRTSFEQKRSNHKIKIATPKTSSISDYKSVYNYGIKSLRELLSTSPSAKPELTLKTTDLVGPEPDRSLNQLNIHTVEEKEDILKIQKCLRNEKYRLKKIAPECSPVKSMERMISFGKKRKEKVIYTIKNQDSTSDNSDCPILKRVLLRKQESEGENDIIIINDEGFVNKHQPQCSPPSHQPVIVKIPKPKEITKERKTKKKKVSPTINKSKKQGKINVSRIPEPVKVVSVRNGGSNKNSEVTSKFLTVELDKLGTTINKEVKRIKRKYIKRSAFWVNRKSVKTKRNKHGKKQERIPKITISTVKHPNIKKSRKKSANPHMKDAASDSREYNDQPSTTDIKKVLQNYITSRRNMSLKKKAAKKGRKEKGPSNRKKSATVVKDANKMIKTKNKEIKRSKKNEITTKTQNKGNKTKTRKMNNVKQSKNKKSTQVEIYVDVEESELLEKVAESLKTHTFSDPLSAHNVVVNSSQTNLEEDDSATIDNKEDGEMMMESNILIAPDEKFEILLKTEDIKTEIPLIPEFAIKNEPEDSEIQDKICVKEESNLKMDTEFPYIASIKEETIENYIIDINNTIETDKL
ncbi:hypothetical protein SNE40_007333 [Patella caerulea]|uniref:C2H2-type domain-containing protein n=1 Tax=Patella caerulea TaxID=87958 RepID=A0AAN8JYL8_PATCE